MNTVKMPEVLIAGGSGLLGTRLCEFLSEKGFRVKILTRNKPQSEASPVFVFWDPEKGISNDEAISHADYIINLAGAGIADKRWTSARKRTILDSRVKASEQLLTTLSRNSVRIKAYIAASAIGIYGNRGNEKLTESSKPGKGFLAGTCLAWETANLQKGSLPFRKVILRLGLVLSEKGGVLPEILKSFRFFIGVVTGNGQQYYSWIHIDDLCRTALKAIEDHSMEGVYNGVAPEPVRAGEMIRIMARVKRGGYVIVRLPAFLFQLLLGERAALLLDSQYVQPARLMAAGFEFKYPDCQSAMKDLVS